MARRIWVKEARRKSEIEAVIAMWMRHEKLLDCLSVNIKMSSLKRSQQIRTQINGKLWVSACTFANKSRCSICGSERTSEGRAATCFYDLHKTATTERELTKGCMNGWIRSVSQSIYYARRLFQPIWTNWIKIALIFLMPFPLIYILRPANFFSTRLFSIISVACFFSFASYFFEPKRMIYSHLDSMYDYFMLLLFATKIHLRFIWYSPNEILQFLLLLVLDTFVELALNFNWISSNTNFISNHLNLNFLVVQKSSSIYSLKIFSTSSHSVLPPHKSFYLNYWSSLL